MRDSLLDNISSRIAKLIPGVTIELIPHRHQMAVFVHGELIATGNLNFSDISYSLIKSNTRELLRANGIYTNAKS